MIPCVYALLSLSLFERFCDDYYVCVFCFILLLSLPLSFIPSNHYGICETKEKGRERGNGNKNTKTHFRATHFLISFFFPPKLRVSVSRIDPKEKPKKKMKRRAGDDEVSTVRFMNLCNCDCLQTILSFVAPLEMWNQRFTARIWRTTVPVALRQITHLLPLPDTYRASCGCQQRKCRTERILELCPNIESIDGDVLRFCHSQVLK